MGQFGNIKNNTPAGIARELGQRLKRARLNANLTQQAVANHAGISRKLVAQAENGKAQLIIFIAIMDALELTDTLDLFLPPQLISPRQLALLQGKVRKRASKTLEPKSQDESEW